RGWRGAGSRAHAAEMIEAGARDVNRLPRFVPQAHAPAAHDASDRGRPETLDLAPPAGRDREEELVVLAPVKRERQRARPRQTTERSGERQARDVELGADAARAADVAEILHEAVAHVDRRVREPAVRETRAERDAGNGQGQAHA